MLSEDVEMKGFLTKFKSTMKVGILFNGNQVYKSVLCTNNIYHTSQIPIVESDEFKHHCYYVWYVFLSSKFIYDFQMYDNITFKLPSKSILITCAGGW